MPDATDRTQTLCTVEHIDERVAILLTWLHHAADLWRKCATQPNPPHLVGHQRRSYEGHHRRVARIRCFKREGPRKTLAPPALHR